VALNEREAFIDASEILYRPLRHWPAAADSKHGPDLSGWRAYCRIET
jgi:hypothetical protein